MDSRIYHVQDQEGESTLVEATSAAQALRFIAQATYGVTVASPKLIASLMAKGNQVLDATKNGRDEEAKQAEARG